MTIRKGFHTLCFSTPHICQQLPSIVDDPDCRCALRRAEPAFGLRSQAAPHRCRRSPSGPSAAAASPKFFYLTLSCSTWPSAGSRGRAPRLPHRLTQRHCPVRRSPCLPMARPPAERPRNVMGPCAAHMSACLCCNRVENIISPATRHAQALAIEL